MEPPRLSGTRRFIVIACGLLAAGAGLPLMLAARPAASPTQDTRGKVVSITSESTPYGMSLFRLWSNGDMEVMVLGQNNVWSDWSAVAPGRSGFAPGAKPGD
jgi:hypothetical protein